VLLVLLLPVLLVLLLHRLMQLNSSQNVDMLLHSACCPSQETDN